MRRTHRIYLDTWLINSAIVGFYAILKNAKKEHLINFNTEENYIDVDESFLDNFEEYYFDYFIDTYKNHLVYSKVLDKMNRVLKSSDDAIIQNLEFFNAEVEYIQSKIALNSTATAFKLANIKESVPKIKKIKITKKGDNILEIKEQLASLMEILKSEKVSRFIQTENVIHLILNNFQANVGPLNKNASKANKFVVYNNYFVEPAEDYLSMDYKFRAETFTCSTCDNPINTKKEAFNLAWIKGVGVDINRKTNYYYDFSNTTFICPVCNLILSCSPAGFNLDINTRKGIFINDNRSVKDLIDANKFTDENLMFSEFENRAYVKYADEINSLTEDTNCNIQVVKFDAESKVLYKFNLLDNEFINMLSRNKNRLAALIDKRVKIDNDYIDLYQASIDDLLRNKNTFSLINTLLNGKYYNNIMLSIILNLSIRDDHTEEDVSLAMKFQNHGARLATRLKAVDENKLYKLKNAITKALKSNNIYSFVELVSIYTSQCNIQMIEEIITVFNKPCSFKLFGYALLIGLYFEKKIEVTKEQEEILIQNDEEFELD